VTKQPTNPLLKHDIELYFKSPCKVIQSSKRPSQSVNILAQSYLFKNNHYQNASITLNQEALKYLEQLVMEEEDWLESSQNIHIKSISSIFKRELVHY
jgi:hypothetical protein